MGVNSYQSTPSLPRKESAPPPSPASLLLEDGTDLLLEDGTSVLLE